MTLRKSAAIIAISFTALLVSTANGQESIPARIDAYIAPFAKAGHFSGQVLVAKDGKTIYEKAFGFANSELGVRNALDTKIGIASITKSMTSVIVRKLIEEKTIALDNTVSKFIPDFPNGDKITVEMLWRHRSGIPHRVMPPENETIPYTSAEMVDRIKLVKLAFEPGTADLYSSAGYTVLARVLEIASGKSYAELLEQYILKPAGMKNTIGFSGHDIISRRASDYLIDADGQFNAPAKDYSFLIGAGSLLSNARDIHAFAMAVVNGVYGDSARAAYVRTKMFSSNGSTNGHRAEVRVNGEHHYSYALVSNLNSGANDMILKALRDILEGKPVTTPQVPQPKFITRAAADLAQYAGDYANEGGPLAVTVNRNFLYAGDVKLAATGGDCFFEYKYYGNVCFVRDPAQKIVNLTWEGPGFKLVWPKL
jgi:CubicO group peptidase (beta-lactamase class C family)